MKYKEIGIHPSGGSVKNYGRMSGAGEGITIRKGPAKMVYRAICPSMFILAVLLSGCMPHGTGTRGWPMMWGNGMPWFMSVMMGVFWIAVIICIVFIVRRLMASERSQGETGDSALRILRERYARGEIDKEEFDEKKRHLERK